MGYETLEFGIEGDASLLLNDEGKKTTLPIWNCFEPLSFIH